MSKEKQIEEMASIINGSINCEYYPEPLYMPSATELYEAGYRKQIEGEWVQLPCKIGDTVYIHGECWQSEEICPYQITNLTITQNKKGVWTKKYRAMWLKNGKTVDAQYNFEFEEIGKTVFLTKEEAEKALAERK